MTLQELLGDLVRNGYGGSVGIISPFCKVAERLKQELHENPLVDGAAYHLNRYGERKADDVYRDLQVLSCGWRVIRFWHNEVMTNPEGCLASVLARIGRSSSQDG